MSEMKEVLSQIADHLASSAESMPRLNSLLGPLSPVERVDLAAYIRRLIGLEEEHKRKAANER